MSRNEALEKEGRLLATLLGRRALQLPVAALQLSPAGWDELLLRAERHGVASRLYCALRAHPAVAAVPGSVQERLCGAYRQTTLRNLQLQTELARLLRILQHHTIEVVALKGAHLLAAVYADLGLRPMADLDLLVRRAKLEQAVELLHGLGYQRLEAPDEEPAALPYHQALFHPRGTVVELHWELERPSPRWPEQAIDEFWARSRPAQVAGVEARVLAPEDLLLHLCIHAAHHHRFSHGLRPLCDLDAVLDRHGAQLDWGVVVQRAEALQMGELVGCCLLAVRDLLAAELPDEVLVHLLAASTEPGMAGLVQSFLLTMGGAPSAAFASALGQGLRRQGRFGWISGLHGALFVPPAQLRTLYPIGPGPLGTCHGYLLRLLDLGRRRGPDLLDLLLGTHRGRAWVRTERMRLLIEQWVSRQSMGCCVVAGPDATD